MQIRRIAARFAIVGALVAVAFLGFSLAGDAPSAEAVPVQPDCTFSPPIEDIIAAGGGSGNVTCDFEIRGEPHTISVEYTADLSARPPITIDSCTLDGEPLHRGPCP